MKVLIFAAFLVCSARKLPPTFKRCNPRRSNFNECLSFAIPDAIHQLKGPIKSVGLPGMDPLVIPAISIGPTDGPTGFEQNYTDFRVSGFGKVSCPEINLDLEGLNMTMSCATPRLTIDTNYVFNGSMAVMDVYGNGTGTIVLDEVRCHHTYHFDEYLKRGKKHLKVTNSSLDVNPRNVTFHFDNLYDGNELLGHNLNLVMNDNWREIWADIKPKYEEVFRRVFRALFNSVLARVALPDMFPVN